MTALEWLAAIHPDPLLTALQGRVSERKARLFACACCRRIAHVLSFPEFIRTVDVAELYADGLATTDECQRAYRLVYDHYVSATPENDTRNCADLAAAWASDVHLGHGGAEVECVRHAADCARGAMIYSPEYDARLAGGPPVPECRNGTPEGLREFAAAAVARAAFEGEERTRLEAEVAACQAAYVRDLFGSPSHLPDFDQAWRTEDVVGLARGMYESRDFGRMSVLADALEVAGCSDTDILAHCRRDGLHVRGCWVVDQVLGKY